MLKRLTQLNLVPTSIFERVLLVLLIFVSLLILKPIPLSLLHAEAVTPPELTSTIDPSNISEGGLATVQLLIKNEATNNTVDNLVTSVSFPESQNPTSLSFKVKADGIDAQNESVSFNLPSGRYLDYVTGSTEYIFGKETGSQVTTPVSDINGTSPLFFEQGLSVNNLESGPNSWVTYRFKVKSVAEKPTIFNPELEFFKYVANQNRSEDFTSKITETSIGKGEIVAVQLFIHNKVLQSEATGVTIKDEDIDINKTLTATMSASSLPDLSASARVTSSVTGDLKIVPGSLVAKDRNGTILKTFSDSEVSKLFGEGLKLNEDGILKGCWEFMRTLEYKVTLDNAGSVGNADISIDKKVRFNSQTYDNVDRSINLYDTSETVDYEITVKNNTSEKAIDVDVEDTLPTYLDFVSCSDSCSYNSSNRMLTFSLGDLAGNSERKLSLSARVKSVLPEGDRTQENLATACADNTGCRNDSAIIWINGPDITTSQVVEDKIIRQTIRQQVLQGVTQLPLTGSDNFLITQGIKLWEVLYRK